MVVVLVVLVDLAIVYLEGTAVKGELLGRKKVFFAVKDGLGIPQVRLAV